MTQVNYLGHCVARRIQQLGTVACADVQIIVAAGDVLHHHKLRIGHILIGFVVAIIGLQCLVDEQRQ